LGVVRFTALLLVCAVSALAGAYLLVRAFASTVEPFSLGTVSVKAVPSPDGHVDVYVPLVDWGIRASPYEAPVAVEMRFRSLNRDEAIDALRGGAPAREISATSEASWPTSVARRSADRPYWALPEASPAGCWEVPW
jgi:hypothetical protein